MSCLSHPQWTDNAEDCPLCLGERLARDKPQLVAYDTLSDGTLVDFEYDSTDDRLHVYAGRALDAVARSEVFTMTLGDFHRFSDHAIHLLLEGRRRRRPRVTR